MKKQLIKWLESNQPFVIYKKPNESNCTLWLQKCSTLFSIQELNKNQEGFIVQSFDSKQNFIFPKNKCSISTLELEDISNSYKKNTTTKEKNLDKDLHKKLIEKAIQTIKNSNLEKVVLSRSEIIDINKNNYFKYFNRLTSKYKTAFCYWWHHPKVGMWMGATPEQFIKINNQTLQTVSLAGTQLANNNTNEKIKWDNKEIKEQETVTQFINDVLKKNNCIVKKTKPYTHKAATLLHIKTDFSAEIKPNTNINKLIQELHPTPALCGFPKQQAFDFIIKNESYKRQFYGGFLGEWNIQKNTDLFVNLRCMQINENKATIYIGGGINNESKPEKEYIETVNKSKTIKNIL